MVGDHPQPHVVGVRLGRRVARVRAVDLAGQLRRPVEDRLDLVDLVQVVDALQDRGDPLQAHAGVDVLVREVPDDPELLLALHVGDLVLHEDQVPELQVPVLVDVRAAVLAVLGPRS